MTAFGGVATGNMKANEEAIVAGSMMYNGSTFIEIACKGYFNMCQCMLSKKINAITIK